MKDQENFTEYILSFRRRRIFSGTVNDPLALFETSKREKRTTQKSKFRVEHNMAYNESLLFCEKVRSFELAIRHVYHSSEHLTHERRQIANWPSRQACCRCRNAGLESADPPGRKTYGTPFSRSADAWTLWPADAGLHRAAALFERNREFRAE